MRTWWPRSPNYIERGPISVTSMLGLVAGNLVGLDIHKEGMRLKLRIERCKEIRVAAEDRGSEMT